MKVQCPYCDDRVQVGQDDSLTEIACSSCGSIFSLVSGVETADYHRRKLGHFDLVETLGTGAFGTVWKARDEELDRFVAVKLPRKEELSEEEQQQFFREARSAAQLKHPSIVSVHEVGEIDGQLYIASELIEGVTLSEWLSGTRLTARESAQLIAQLAQAIAHAHQQGVTHRDLKPQNVMMDGQGRPHIADFGLAKRAEGEVTMTVEGQIVGTPAYMSPEQARGSGHLADARGDIYSLGVMLFELLTGELPFRGAARMVLLQVIHDEPPSPRRLDSRIPRDLETIVLKCLQKTPQRRYLSAQALADDLQNFLDGHQIVARPVGRITRGWRWCKRHPAVATLASAVITMVLTILIGFSIGLGIVTAKQSELSDTRQHLYLANANISAANRDLVQARVSAQNKAEAARSERLIMERRTRNLSDQFGLISNVLLDLDPSQSIKKPLKEVLTQRMAILRDQPDLEMMESSLRKSEVGIPPTPKNVEQLKEAQNMIKEARAEHGARHVRALTAECDYCRILLGTGLDAEAVTYLEELAPRMDRELGNNHEKALEGSVLLARAYRSVGQNRDAIAQLERITPRLRLHLGDSDQRTIRALETWAIASEDVGDIVQAASVHEVAMNIRTARDGPTHPTTLVTIGVQARLIKKAGRLEDSLKLYRQAYEGLRDSFGANDEKTLSALNNYALALLDSNRVAQSLPLLELAYAQTEGRSDRRKIRSGIISQNLGSAYLRTGQTEKGLPLIHRFATSARSSHSDTPLRLASVLELMTHELLRSQLYLHAEPYARECLFLRSRGVASAGVMARTRLLVGEALLGQNESAKAKELLQPSRARLLTQEALTNPEEGKLAARTVKRISKLYERMGRAKEARSWQALLEKVQSQVFRSPDAKEKSPDFKSDQSL